MLNMWQLAFYEQYLHFSLERMQYNLKIYTEKMVKQLSLGYIASKYNKQVWIKRYLKKKWNYKMTFLLKTYPVIFVLFTNLLRN